MTKDEFLGRLSDALTALDPAERARMVQYYREIIEDRMEDGLPQEQAVQELEDVEIIADRILQELAPGEDRPAAPKKTSAFTITMLVLGSPVWLPLLLAAGIVALAFYAVVWALVITLFAVVFSLGCAGIAGVVSLFIYWKSRFLAGLFLLGIGLICAGAAIALFFPVRAAVKKLLSGTAKLGRKAWRKLDWRTRKEDAA